MSRLRRGRSRSGESSELKHQQTLLILQLQYSLVSLCSSGMRGCPQHPGQLSAAHRRAPRGPTPAWPVRV